MIAVKNAPDGRGVGLTIRRTLYVKGVVTEQSWQRTFTGE